MKLLRTETVSVEPLSDILVREADGIRIDVLNIDVEGMNLEVLETFDWSNAPPRVICIEDDDLVFTATMVSSPIHSYLSQRGYTLKGRAGQSSLYLHVE